MITIVKGNALDFTEDILIHQVNCKGIMGGGIALAIKKMRQKDVFIQPGYDGVYGVVKFFKPGELDQGQQLGLGI
jgi:O-acetyl-ADP-ribose deacetylase (regulator of RNase III)